MHRLMFIAVSLGLISWFTIGPAHGSPIPASSHDPDSTNNGNGNHNRNAIGIKSPTSNHGYQHTSNGNAGGLNSTLNMLCRQVVKCRMTQNFIIMKTDKKEPVNKNDQTPWNATSTGEAAAPTAADMPAYAFLYQGPDGTVAIR